MNVWGWGNSNCGALGIGQKNVNISSPQKINKLNNIGILSCGPNTLAAIDIDGKLYLSGKLPNEKEEHEIIQYSWNTTNKIQNIFLSNEYVIILTETEAKWSEVWSWGKGEKGQLGLGSSITNQIDQPKLIEEISGYQISSISISETNVMSLTNDGKLFIWGSNTKNCTGIHPKNEILYQPNLFTGLDNYDILNITCGNEYFYAGIGIGQFYCWGSSDLIESNGMLGNGNFPANIISSLRDIEIIEIYSGGNYCIGLNQLGKLYSWGNGNENQLLQQQKQISSPKDIKSLNLYENIQISTSLHSVCCIHSNPNTLKSFYSIILSSKSFMAENVHQMEEQIRQVENISKLLEIELSLINGNDYSIVNDTRVFIMKAQMKIGGMDGQCFMFDDSLLLCRKKDKKRDRYEVYQMIYFESAVLGKQLESSNKFGFEIRETSKVSKFIPLEFNKKNEKELWFVRIQQQIEIYGGGGKEDENSKKNRPPSYVPPAPTSSSRGLQKTISLSNMGKSHINQSVGDMQANLKAKTKNLKFQKIPRFSNRTFQKLEKKVVALTEGPLLTTEGASMPMDSPHRPIKQIGSSGNLNSPLPSPNTSSSNIVPPLGVALPTIPSSPRRNLTGSGNAPSIPAKPKSNIQEKPSLPEKPPLPGKPSTLPKLNDTQTLCEIRKLLNIDENEDVIQKVKDLLDELNRK